MPTKKSPKKATPTTKSTAKSTAKTTAKAPAKSTPKKRVIFRVNCKSGSKVFVAGTFNDWKPDAKALKDKGGNGQFEATAMLSRGRYEYKFIVNKEWRVDPDCENWVQNEHGTLNSVIEVK